MSNKRQELLILRGRLGSVLLIFLIFCVVFFVLFVFVMCLMYPMLSVSLDCSFLSAPSDFSTVYLYLGKLVLSQLVKEIFLSCM